jgi:hypothetical protein
MADRKVHYEAAFEEYLRGRGIPYVAVDEAKRALFSSAKLKSFDFVVYGKQGSGRKTPGSNLLVDVKGRSCRDRTVGGGVQNWVMQVDVDDLIQWQEVFGEGFRALFAFVYWIECPLIPEEGTFEFRQRWYRAMGVDVTAYREVMRRRSLKWGTVCLRSEDFRSLARPIAAWL